MFSSPHDSVLASNQIYLGQSVICISRGTGTRSERTCIVAYVFLELFGTY